MISNIYSTFSDVFSPNKICIAGGAVRDTLLGREPKDFDVFVFVPQWESWNDFRAHFVEEFQSKLNKYPEVISDIEWHKSEPFFIRSIEYHSKEIQVMTTPEKDMEALVDTFDWNICQFAYGERNGSVDFFKKNVELDDIKSGGYLRLNKITYPYSTLRRGYRFSERFHMRLATEDIKRLCSDIMKPKIGSESAS